MSILIKGMEMPTNGAERCIVIRGDGTIRTFTGALIDYATAVPVPPHGRLIDADVLSDDLITKTVHIEAAGPLLRMVRAAPTIIEAEEGEESRE